MILMRKVFLDELPRKGKIIDWKTSIGHTVKFVYDDIEGFIKINELVRENGRSVLILENMGNNKIFKMKTDHFKRCKLGNFLMVQTREFRIEIGESFKDEKRDLHIIDRKYEYVEYNKHSKQYKKMYKYHCNNCGNEDWMQERNLLINKHGCNVCCDYPQKVLKGYNDIATTSPWMVKYFKDKENAYTHTCCSGDKVMMVCPNCNHEKRVVISSVYLNKSIGCPYCREGVSFSEKTVMSLLDQLNINYFREYSPVWCNNRRYDFYFEYNDNKYIIETHGSQHYIEHSFCGLGGRTLEEERINDIYKKELALQNGIDYYIVLDCRESNIEFIKASILSSELSYIFNLSNIDWLECEKFALGNMCKQVCEYWNNKEEWETTKDLAKIFKMDRNSISSYLKKGQKIGWCLYNPEEELNKGRKKNSLTKKVEVYKNDTLLGVYDNPNQVCENIDNIDIYGIYRVCSGRQKTHKGYTFKYVKK